MTGADEYEDGAAGTGPFAQLHPAVQHHVVNTLGWRTLRSHQEDAIAPILDGRHVLVQAPTAGGKTEAAMLPLLSRMLAERWGQPSVLYLCPIKALLNNLDVRLTRLAGMVGRTVGLWHGDVSQPARRRLLANRPDILLATPESIEVMLVSRLVDHRQLFSGVRAIVVDEVHAFAGDDRGWHLLALMERVSALAEQPVQRVALSATLGNPEALLDWFTARRPAPREVVIGRATQEPDPDVLIDWVGSLDNAALVISRLHHGEKRLVFCDSRRQVEELAQGLRTHGIRTFVSHSSLSVDERRQAEQAFAEGSDCVIVATSTLELGIDVGDLDRVIQIDAPTTVASFLQRIGRTGRRPGGRRNCLFLATSTDDLLRACGLVRLWEDGYVEPIVAPPLPYHVLLQQIMALVLQEGGAIPHGDLRGALGAWCETAAIDRKDLTAAIEHLLSTDVLYEDGGTLLLGRVGEERYGARHFLELFSVFNTSQLVTVYHGRQELGQVHPSSFQRSDTEEVVLGLSGRSWHVTHLDLRRQEAFVEPAASRGKSRWLGDGPPLSYAVSQAIARVLAGSMSTVRLSRRAVTALEELREEFTWLDPSRTTLFLAGASDTATWWNFAGDRFNAAVGRHLSRRLGSVGAVSADALSVRFQRPKEESGTAQALVAMLDEVRALVADGAPGWVTPPPAMLPKFGESLSGAMQAAMLRVRSEDRGAGEALRGREIRPVLAAGPEAGR